MNPPDPYPHLEPDTALLDAQLYLLDRQVVDRDGVPVMIVDDLELSDVAAGSLPAATPAPTVTSLLTGPVLLTRIFGGRPPHSYLQRVEWRLVQSLGVVVTLRARTDELDVSWMERWVRDKIIARIPGGRHDPE